MSSDDLWQIFYLSAITSLLYKQMYNKIVLIYDFLHPSKPQNFMKLLLHLTWNHDLSKVFQNTLSFIPFKVKAGFCISRPSLNTLAVKHCY